jgi:hypothetical protein
MTSGKPAPQYELQDGQSTQCYKLNHIGEAEEFESVLANTNQLAGRGLQRFAL